MSQEHLSRVIRSQYSVDTCRIFFFLQEEPPPTTKKLRLIHKTKGPEPQLNFQTGKTPQEILQVNL